MRLYKYAIGSDDDEADVINHKRHIADFDTLEALVGHIHRQYAPVLMRIVFDRIIDGHIILAAVPGTPEGQYDEVLWVIGR